MKPELIDRLKNTLEGVEPGDLIMFSNTAGTKVITSGISATKVADIVNTNKSVIDHITDESIHLTKREKSEIINATEEVVKHLTKSDIHVTPTDRENWDNKETPEGAQAKINIAFNAVKQHIEDRSKHVSQTDRLNWNNRYTKEEIDNKLSVLEYNNVWKASVETMMDLINTYRNPRQGWTVTVNEDNITYRYDGENWIPISANSIPLATAMVDGKMSKEDKAKLDGIENNANHYVHPDNPHTRHITDDERVLWTNKAEKDPVTYEYNGLMRKEDKEKLDGIEDGATNFVMPNKLEPSIIDQDANNRFVTDEEKTYWSNKANGNLATDTLDGLLSKYDKIKLNSVEHNANYYKHPDKHPADIITQDTLHRFVSDEDILRWNNKLDTVMASDETGGAMSKEDKIKLDGIEEGANNYKLPAQLPPSIITQDANNRFFTDAEREALANKKDNKDIITGTGFFKGTNGTIVEHDFGNTSFAASITPTSNPGNIGRIWVKKTNTLMIVYCDGDDNVPFDYTMIYYN